MVESPQSFIVAEECDKATWQNGFRRKLGESEGWAAYESTTANGAVYLAADGRGGPWHLAIEHSGVIAELGVPPADLEGPGRTRYSFENLPGLYATLGRVYALALSLPDSPLQAFRRHA
jgi:hypothetical protein